MKINKNTVIYQAKSGAIELRGDFTRETVWATRTQMADMFGVNPQAISKHIQNIYEEGELKRSATSSKMNLGDMSVLVAESDPKHKDQTIKLILNLLSYGRGK